MCIRDSLRLEVHELIGAGLDRIRELQHRQLTLGGGCLAPHLEGCCCGGVGPVHVGSRGHRRRGDHLSGHRADDVGGRVALGLDIEPESDATSDIVSPVTAQVVATAPVSSAADVDRAYAAAAVAFEVWGDTTPAERQQALLKFADEVERRADEFVHLETENTGKPYALTASEEMPPMVDQIRFFAGAARILEGRSAGEYMLGHTSWI